jgi:hypothetical protein
MSSDVAHEKWYDVLLHFGDSTPSMLLSPAFALIIDDDEPLYFT